MTEKELKKLNRKQLLELLLKQTERADELEEKLNEAIEKLNDRTLAETEAGSIAEAALKLNGVFQAADEAAAQYLENVRKLTEDREAMIKAAEEEARKRADAILEETERKCAKREALSVKRLKAVSSHLQKMYKQKKVLDSAFKDFSGLKDDEN